MPEFASSKTGFASTALPTVLHDPAPSPLCVHLVGPMPNAIVVDRAAVSRLNFQLRFTRGPQPVLAARRGNILVLAVNLVGPLHAPHPSRGRDCADHRLRHRWYFELAKIDGDPLRLNGFRVPVCEVAGA